MDDKTLKELLDIYDGINWDQKFKPRDVVKLHPSAIRRYSHPRKDEPMIVVEVLNEPLRRNGKIGGFFENTPLDVRVMTIDPSDGNAEFLWFANYELAPW